MAVYFFLNITNTKLTQSLLVVPILKNTESIPIKYLLCIQ